MYDWGYCDAESSIPSGTPDPLPAHPHVRSRLFNSTIVAIIRRADLQLLCAVVKPGGVRRTFTVHHVKRTPSNGLCSEYKGIRSWPENIENLLSYITDSAQRALGHKLWQNTLKAGTRKPRPAQRFPRDVHRADAAATPCGPLKPCLGSRTTDVTQLLLLVAAQDLCWSSTRQEAE